MIKYNGPQILLIISATFLSFNPPKKKDDFLGNKRRSAIWAFQDMIGRLGKPVEKTRWSMTPPMVNA